MTMIVPEQLNCCFFVVRRNVRVTKCGGQALVTHALLSGPGIHPTQQGMGTKYVLQLMQWDPQVVCRREWLQSGGPSLRLLLVGDPRPQVLSNHELVERMLRRFIV